MNVLTVFAIILVLLWATGHIVSFTAGGIINILLVIALIFIIIAYLPRPKV